MSLYQKMKIPPVYINGCTNTVKFRKKPSHKHRFMLVMFEAVQHNTYVLFKVRHENDVDVVEFDVVVIR